MEQEIKEYKRKAKDLNKRIQKAKEINKRIEKIRENIWKEINSLIESEIALERLYNE